MSLGELLGASLAPGSVVALFGELGAGKTRFIQGVCRALGVARFVASPSFVLINEYRGRMPVYHFDFYRIQREEELAELGLEEYFYGEGVCLIEWAERALRLLPPERIDVAIATCGVDEPNRRRIAIARHGG
jgi:tRNA threonylcarbamoyladenosine biosynthesis protein TsaE